MVRIVVVTGCVVGMDPGTPSRMGRRLTIIFFFLCFELLLCFCICFFLFGYYSILGLGFMSFNCLLAGMELDFVLLRTVVA